MDVIAAVGVAVRTLRMTGVGETKKNLINVVNARKKKSFLNAIVVKRKKSSQNVDVKKKILTNANVHMAIILTKAMIMDLITNLNMKIHVAAERTITDTKNTIKKITVGINTKRVDRNIYSFVS